LNLVGKKFGLWAEREREKDIDVLPRVGWWVADMVMIDGDDTRVH
jgi:hypothetical protein